MMCTLFPTSVCEYFERCVGCAQISFRILTKHWELIGLKHYQYAPMTKVNCSRRQMN